MLSGIPGRQLRLEPWASPQDLAPELATHDFLYLATDIEDLFRENVEVRPHLGENRHQVLGYDIAGLTYMSVGNAVRLTPDASEAAVDHRRAPCESGERVRDPTAARIVKMRDPLDIGIFRRGA